ncbi:hypothetical protein B0J12DRAFT_155644 [Macrophomina phaseolina]|uniref:Uncharacterized protein n=1 Tax=Macrophomina phaseolina TaxID=35725 RepID=A0ABQ8G5K2_9PEZI|nr:hypothetical protein B0J12DRAFT_155644 [Macrophomina phaseolina]
MGKNSRWRPIENKLLDSSIATEAPTSLLEPLLFSILNLEQPSTWVSGTQRQRATLCRHKDGNENCSNCIGCKDCMNCSNCTNCTACSFSSNLQNCQRSQHCSNSSNLIDCDHCSNCSNLKGRSNASNEHGIAW